MNFFVEKVIGILAIDATVHKEKGLAKIKVTINGLILTVISIWAVGWVLFSTTSCSRGRVSLATIYVVVVVVSKELNVVVVSYPLIRPIV